MTEQQKERAMRLLIELYCEQCGVDAPAIVITKEENK